MKNFKGAAIAAACIVTAVVFVQPAAAAKGKDKAEKKLKKILKTDVDSVSYYLGIDFGNALTQTLDGMYFSLDAFEKGVIAFITDESGDDALHDGAVKYLRHYFTERIPAKELAESEAFLNSVVATNPYVIKTETGLIYQILEQGDPNIKARDHRDKVRVSYVGTFRDGTELDSSDDVEFTLNKLIKGFSEGLQLIGKGGRVKLWVHPRLAYGLTGSRNKVKPNAALVYDLTLLEVIPYQEQED